MNNTHSLYYPVFCFDSLVYRFKEFTLILRYLIEESIIVFCRSIFSASSGKFEHAVLQKSTKLLHRSQILGIRYFSRTETIIQFAFPPPAILVSE